MREPIPRQTRQRLCGGSPTSRNRGQNLLQGVMGFARLWAHLAFHCALWPVACETHQHYHLERCILLRAIFSALQRRLSSHRAVVPSPCASITKASATSLPCFTRLEANVIPLRLLFLSDTEK